MLKSTKTGLTENEMAVQFMQSLIKGERSLVVGGGGPSFGRLREAMHLDRDHLVQRKP